MNRTKLQSFATSRPALVGGAALFGAALTAAWVERRSRRAERDQAPAGRLLDVDGVRLHVVERGEGPPVVLIHGNLVTARDFEASGLLQSLSRNHHVIAFDRPGFGHSTRPRDRLWTPSAQAELLHAAFAQLGVQQAVVVGHSMGAMVALALALDHPEDVQRLVLLGGYYYPTARIDAMITAPVALPVVGDVMRYTVTAISARLLLNGMVKAMFAPREVPGHFISTLSREMMVRPVQLRANAEDAAFMIPQAKSSSERHQELRMPVAIFAGADDLVVDVEANATRLHRDLPGSTLAIVPGAGHMVHHAAPDEIAAAVESSGVFHPEPIRQGAAGVAAS